MEIVAENTKEKGTTDKLFNFRPVFFAAVFLCLGIVFAYMRILNGVSAWWGLLLLPMLITPIFFCVTPQKRYKTMLAVGVLALCFCVGNSAFVFKLDAYSSSGVYKNQEAVILGRVVEKRVYEDVSAVILDGVYIDKNEEEGKLIAYLPASFLENIRLSDKVMINGKVTALTENISKNEFWIYNVGEDIRFRVLQAESCIKTGENFDLFLFIRQKMTEKLYIGMEENAAAVTVALLLGDVSGIEEGLLENVHYGGIAHIFAVSGLHVGTLYAFCLTIMKKGRLQNTAKWIKFLLMTSILFLYAGVCGFSISVVRASIVCLSAYAALLIGTETDFLQSLGLAAIVILLFSPTSLFEVGFQLSFAACLGLALLSRPISSVLDKCSERLVGEPNVDSPLNIPQRIARAIVSFLSACLAAQIATAPIQLHAFGYLSVWALLLNCLFVPLISVAFSFLLAFALLSCVLPNVLVMGLLQLPSVLWSGMLLLFEIADYSAFALTGLRISAGATVCYYGGVQFLSDKWNVKRSRKWGMAGLCFLAFAITMVALNVV